MVLHELAAALSSAAIIACSQYTPGPDSLYNAVPFKQWKTIACKKYLEYGDSVQLQVITSRAKGFKENTAPPSIMLGTVSVGGIRGGRSKVIWESEKTDQHVHIWLNVKAYKNVLVFKNSLQPFQRILPADVEKSEKDIARYLGVKDVLTETPINKVVVKQARKGQVITNDAISPPPLVSNQTPVTIVIAEGSLKVTSKGLAMSNGWNLGDNVVVKASNAQGTVKGQVIGKNKVHVEI